MRSLRLWFRKPDAQRLGSSSYLRTLRTVGPTDFWDLHCLVLAVEPASDGAPAVLWVWDGHDACPLPVG